MYFYAVRRKQLAMLDLLIEVARDNDLSDPDIREEIDTFIFAVYILLLPYKVVKEKHSAINISCLQITTTLHSF